MLYFVALILLAVLSAIMMPVAIIALGKGKTTACLLTFATLLTTVITISMNSALSWKASNNYGLAVDIHIVVTIILLTGLLYGMFAIPIALSNQSDASSRVYCSLLLFVLLVASIGILSLASEHKSTSQDQSVNILIQM